MDLDLFNDDFDDEILSCVPMDVCASSEEADRISEEPSNNTPEFDCLGEDSVKRIEFSRKTFTRNMFLKNYDDFEINILEFPPYKVSENMFNISSVSDFVFNQCRINVQILLSCLSSKMEHKSSFYELRKQITTLMHMMRSGKATVLHQTEGRMNVFRTFLNRIFTEKFIKLFFMANHSRGNEIDLPAYHVLHGFLEWKLIDLQVIQRQEMSEKGLVNTEDGSLFQTQSKRFLKDLIFISLQYFNKNLDMDLNRISPFPCSCIKECWLVLQVLFDKMNLHFWTYFNEGTSGFEKELSRHNVTEANFSIFKLWILNSLVRLENFKIASFEFDFVFGKNLVENNDYLKETVEKFCKLDPSEEQSRRFLRLLMPIVLCWWSPRTDIPMILWEYFHKKLNSSFVTPGAMLVDLGVSSSSGKGYLQKVEDRMNISESNILDPNHESETQTNLYKKNSFYLFTMVIGKTIQKFAQTHQIHQINKMLGRVFAKFSAQKLIALTECGLHNLIELFLSFSVASGQNDILTKLKDKLLLVHLSQLTVSRQTAVTKGHIAFMILSCQQEVDISEYVKKFLEQISQVKVNENQHIVRLLAGGLEDIFHESLNLYLGQAKLIDSWLTNYLQSSSSCEQERIYEFLHNLLTRIKDQLEMNEIKNAIEINVLPFIKQNFSTSFSPWIPVMAADLCLSNSSTDSSLVEKNIKFFIESNCISKDYLIKFLASLMSSNRKEVVASTTIIKIWLRSLVILSGTHEDVSRMTNIVMDLEEFKTVCGGFEKDLLTSKEPLYVFVSSVGKNYSTLTQFQRKREVSEKFNLYLNNFDKWIMEKNEKPDVLQRFYSFLAIVIYNCAGIVYEKARTTCFFHVAVTRFILPPSIQLGKVSDSKLIQIIHKIWPVVVQGMALLNFKGDPYVFKTLNDLIQKWTPLFKFSSNTKLVAKPFISLMNGDNTAIVLFVLEKLTTMFLTAQRRQSDPNACLVLTIFHEIVSASSESVPKLELFLKGTCFSCLEHLMMVDDVVPSKKMIIQLYEKVVRTNVYRDNVEVRNMIEEHLKNLTVKHLAYNTFFFFELLENFIKVEKRLVEDIMDFLLEQIVIVEGKRGGGHDNRIRNCFEKLKVAVKK
ncbi:MMS22L family protein [Megaselia abdita]